MTRNIRLFIEDILAAINKLETKTKDMTYEQFCDDTWFLDAVINNFHIIGEAVKKVPEQIKAKYPQVPWTGMAGMRDILSHQYFSARTDILWKTIKERNPQIKPVLEKILRELE